MKVYHSLESFKKSPGSVATIGTFDGLHQGHQVILDRLKEVAREVGGETVIISFHPHPRLVLFPDDNPLRLLHTLDEKIAMLDKAGIDKFLVIPFTREFSRTTSDTFIEDILVKTVGIGKIIIGYDHQFGRGREGGLKEMMLGGEKFGFEVEEIPAHQIDHNSVSSTKIRNALLEGKVDEAFKYLGYHYQLSGTVVHGQEMGRKIGFPTANIQPEGKLKLIPGDGVYWVEVEWEGQHKFGMMNIGHKPTAGEFKRSIEVNIFDFEGDLYEKRLTVHFRKRIRDEQKFPGLDALKAQIARDKEACLKLISQES
ncbi:MAG: bifunctional riboflavin kinase/FAD synthetase [Bacteroidia bacterium]|nr:bifunctional riboflavin kinase/FAD synthetase [Bacteroidia bacterium]